MASPTASAAPRPRVRLLDRTTPPHIATLIAITSLAALSMNLFLPSLPSMTAFFDTQYGIMQIAVAGYLGVNAVMQLVIGPISDRYGRRAVLLVCIAVFIVASVGCTLATTIEVFLFFRLMQAAIIAGLVLPRAAIRDMFPQAEAASMIGWVTMGMSVAPMIAPAIGGALEEAFAWQSNFVALGLLGVIVGALVWADMGETAPPRGTSFRAQVVDECPELFRSRRFWGYVLAAAFASGAFFSYLGGAPFVGSEVFGMSPAELGIYFGAPAVGYLVGNGISGRYSSRVGINRMILWGAAVTLTGMTASLAIFLAGFGSAAVFFGFTCFVGLGNGMVIPNSMAGMLSVRPHLAGTASGVGGATMVGGGAAMSALAGVLLGPGSGALPLIWLMTATSALSLGSILYTIRRDRQVAAAR